MPLTSILMLLAPAAPLAGQSAGDSLKVLAVERAAEAAIVQGSAAALDTLWAVDLRFVHSDGQVDGRAAWQRRIREGAPRFLERSLDSLSVEIHERVAIASGRVHVRTDPSDEYWVRYLRVYARRHGRWLLIRHQSLSLSTTPP